MYNSVLLSSESYKVAIYIRLSKEDVDKFHKRESESESILNQRSLLMNYLKDNGFILCDEYADDGFSGTNFDRPEFIRLISDIENGKINCVITKDLSRLGRDYIQCGYYVEQYFPLKKVRYISILDNVDTFLDSANNDIAPFKALFNDMTSKDTSKKIRSILKNKKFEGKFIGSKPSYGYMRDPLDKGHLILDPLTAPIVKKIFKDLFDGNKVIDIIERLNNEQIPTPSTYKGTKASKQQKIGNIWTHSSLNKIIKNRMYTGDMIQNVQAKLNYKSQKRIALSSENWIIVENTHEALVDRNIWKKLQNTTYRTRVNKHNRPKRLLEGLVFCKECGNMITVSYKEKTNYWTMNCNKYSRSPRLHLCSSHFFNYNLFEKIILDKVKRTYEEYMKEININEILTKIKVIENNENNLNEEKEKLVNTISELQKKIDSLYDDKYNGIIGLDTYSRLSEKTENSIKQNKLRIGEIETKLKQNKNKQFCSLESNIKKQLDIKEPSRDLVFTLINEILVDKDKNIEIIYNFKK
ncbi:MAG: recombinase family protein [Bacilli bacterium]